MTKPTDREALAILAGLAHELYETGCECCGAVPGHLRIAYELDRVGLTKPEAIAALSEEPAREVEMLTREEIAAAINHGPGVVITEIIQHACAAKWVLKIKEPK